MKKVVVGLVVAAGVILLVIVAAGAIFYVRVYRPIGSPLMAISAGKVLEDRRLNNQAEFVPPTSGDLTATQAERFVAVEDEVLRRLAVDSTVLVRAQADLEQASNANTLSVRTTLTAFSDIRNAYLNAKVVQIDAMNRQDFSKTEFEWIRRRLYSAAGLRFSQLDVSDLLAGDSDAAVIVRHFDASDRVPEQEGRLARPLASKLQAWLPLGFFGL